MRAVDLLSGVTRQAAAVRLRLTARAFGLVFLCFVGMGLAITAVVAVGMVWLILVIPVLMVVVTAVRWFADLHRRWASEVLETPIPRPYLPLPERGVLARLLALAKDPATWRDLLWLLVNATAGFFLVGMVCTLAMSTIGFAGLPVAWPFLPEDVPPRTDEDFRSLTGDWGLVVVTDWQSALLASVQAIPMLAIWWWATPRLIRLDARLMSWFLSPTDASMLSARVEQLAESRAETVDTQAAELRRIERDLHDGAQARLVSLGMSLGLAEQLMANDPDAAQELLAEARESTGLALAELRDLVRGIHPPVLADRGLQGAVQALALSYPGEVDVEVSLPARPEPTVESAGYFAVAEALTNVAKHAHASQVWVQVWYADGRLRLAVGDDGKGGARIEPAGGLHGVERRLAAFDGTVSLTSPQGGPTIVTMELPCVLSSPRISPSSETG
ncbi:sensor histidine kinase [Phytoactinopolyspora endophytica]|uniref:sensor histidine kinase n=1 Tax=Phytoactinopolyspora endophytica TaxID=1642495 RepID=UPI00101C3833|nr:sensor domain-containing protein [Phytoactinopolyspora endophytica]